MRYANLDTEALFSPDALKCHPVQRATWIWLLAYCARQENGGRIAGCAEWKDRTWQQVCAVTRDEVHAECALWYWDAHDLVVRHYPLDKESEIVAKRCAATETNRSRWSGKALARASKVSKVRSASRSAYRSATRSPISPLSSTAASPQGGGIQPSMEVPKIEDVKSYASEIDLDGNQAESFHDHFTSNGWKVGGKTPMRDWKAALRNWKRRAKTNTETTSNGKPTAFTLKTKLEGLESRRKEIERCAHESAFGLEFSNPQDKRKHRDVCRQIADTKNKMAEL